ncbi:MAG: hypothetical protein WA943_14170 [Parvibaculum sp.]|uniref:hypothetical protein n=1 Tax=Parvibaculum sp. TaxID=2024848 RepID=UPI003C75226E
MNIMQTARKAGLALVAASALLAVGAMETPALAHGRVSIGIGLGFPLFPAYGYGYGSYYGGYYGGYYPPYYYRPYYAPPVVYAPAYAPPVVYQQPVQAVPTSDVYRSDNGQYCREYQSTVRVAGRYQNSYGTACQDADGTWRIAN